MEKEFLQWVKQQVKGSDSVPIGIGDDTALVEISDRSLVCSDLVAEGTHFSIDQMDDYILAGRKALAVNLSDIAAMGGIPRYATASLLIPKKDGLEIAKKVTQGLLELAEQFGVQLVGGDTCSWNGPVVVDVTVIGDCHASGQVLKRSGVQEGDFLFCTGDLGGSLSGRHSRFLPRCREIKKLMDDYPLRCGTDISDGLVADLASLLHRSTGTEREDSFGAKLYGNSIPISESATQCAAPKIPGLESISIPGLCNALYDGEDFELLFAVSEDVAKKMVFDIQAKRFQPGCRLSMIGKVVPESNISLLLDELVFDLPKVGYLH